MIVERAAVIICLAFAACGDPAAPNAEGTISLGTSADAGGLVSVEVRMCPADAGLSPSCGVMSLSTSVRPDGGFPVAYRVGEGRLGTSPVKDWKVIVWINRADAGAAPAPGDWWGEASFALRSDCGCATTCYCAGATANISIDRVAP